MDIDSFCSKHCTATEVVPLWVHPHSEECKLFLQYPDSHITMDQIPAALFRAVLYSKDPKMEKNLYSRLYDVT